MSKIDYFKELNYRLRGLPEKERQNILSVYEELFQKAIENGKHEDEVAQSLGYPRVPNWDAQKDASAVSPPEAAKSAKQESIPQAPIAPQTPPTPKAHQAYQTPQAPKAPPLEKIYTKPEPAAPKQAPETGSFTPPPYTPPPYENPYYAQQPPYPYPAKQETGLKAIIVSIALGFFNLLFVVGPWFGILAALIALFASGFALIVAPIAGMLGSFMEHVGSDLQFIGFTMLACFGLGIILTTLSTWLLQLFFKITRAYIQFNAKLIKGA
ncbi:HAAS signaling domain-containing protein [Paenibacillus sp. WC2504]|uniref:HAAS signaling domain-containing protein n=1 Tax=Paenibacillus sp. WC2504 TaxID=3461403 RepID=UPI004045B668